MQGEGGDGGGGGEERGRIRSKWTGSKASEGFRMRRGGGPKRNNGP
jgi:hypothetical protein